MNLEEFQENLVAADNDILLRQFCQNRILHGTPFCFDGNEDEWFHFKSEIAEEFEIQHTDVMIVGSAKLGFSPVKRTEFSLESDIDVAIISEVLFEQAQDLACSLEYELRWANIHLPNYQFRGYLNFLRFLALGWVRPDLAPRYHQLGQWKNRWFDFFNRVSYDQCRAGNYKVNAGVFKTYERLERYTIRSMGRVRETLLTEQT